LSPNDQEKGITTLVFKGISIIEKLLQQVGDLNVDEIHEVSMTEECGV
jgi:hypothetical protein